MPATSGARYRVVRRARAEGVDLVAGATVFAVARLDVVLAAEVLLEAAFAVVFLAAVFVVVALAAVFFAAVLVVVALAVVFFAAVFLLAVFFEFRASLKAEAGAKRTAIDAGILTGVLLCGLRPIRAARDLGVNVPNPKTDTFSPDLVSAITVSVNAFTAASACFRSSPVSAATASTSPVLFTATSWVRFFGEDACHQRGFSVPGQVFPCLTRKSEARAGDLGVIGAVGRSIGLHSPRSDPNSTSRRFRLAGRICR